MDEQPATLHSVTVAEAAAILGVSTATVRRMVKRGQLEGERILRPQGSVFVVRLPEHVAPSDSDASTTLHDPGGVSRGNASPGDQLAAWSETFMLPLVAALERSQATVRDQAETIGRQSAELERAASTIVTLNAALEARTAAQDVEALRDLPEPRWRLWVTWGLTVLVLAVLAGVLVWPR